MTIIFICYIQRLSKVSKLTTEVLSLTEATTAVEGDSKIVNMGKEKDEKGKTVKLNGRPVETGGLNLNPTSTLSSDNICEPVLPQLSDVPLPQIGLISFPGSGNTWTRHLIQQVSGQSRFLFLSSYSF